MESYKYCQLSQNELHSLPYKYSDGPKKNKKTESQTQIDLRQGRLFNQRKLLTFCQLPYIRYFHKAVQSAVTPGNQFSFILS